jgi:hypothetical protein
MNFDLETESIEFIIDMNMKCAVPTFFFFQTAFLFRIVGFFCLVVLVLFIFDGTEDFTLARQVLPLHHLSHSSSHFLSWLFLRYTLLYTQASSYLCFSCVARMTGMVPLYPAIG